MRTLDALLLLTLVGTCYGAGGGGVASASSSGGRFKVKGESVTYFGQHFVAEGEKFTISCILHINDYLQWTVNNRPVIPGEAGYTMIEGPGRQGYIVSRVIVMRAHAFHAGEYKCTPLSSESHSVFIISGSLTETEGTRRLVEGKPLSLTCDYNATELHATWIKDGDELFESDHIKLYTNTTLYIASATKQDLGNYTCKLPGEQDPRVINVVEISLHKNLPKSTTVLENDKLSLTCLVEGDPFPVVQWLKDGEPIQDTINSSRMVLSENEYHVPNSSLLIKPIMKSDDGTYICLVSQYSIQLNTTTDVRVKDIYAALWPFLGIVAEVLVLCTIIFIYEKRRIKPNFDDSDTDQISEQKSKAENNKEADVRQRK